jgi:hypothetical protein
MMEWDMEILKSLKRLRRADPTIDYKLACLVYYNREISESEWDRRLDSLHEGWVNRAVMDCNAWKYAPRQESWHISETPKFSEDAWRSVTENWENTLSTLVDIPETHLQKRRDSYADFYDLKWRCWNAQLSRELEAYKEQESLYGEFSIPYYRASMAKFNQWKKVWREKWGLELERHQEKCVLQEHQLRMDYAIARNSGASPEDLEIISRKIGDCITQAKSDKEKISERWIRMDAEKMMIREQDQKALNWYTIKKPTLDSIKSRLTRDYKELSSLQEVDRRDLFPAAEKINISVQCNIDHQDLNQEILSALADHSSLTSPADRSSLRGYGDGIEWYQRYMETPVGLGAEPPPVAPLV